MAALGTPLFRWRRRRPAGSAAERGFTLLEAVVVLALVSVGLFLAAGFLAESRSLFARSARELRNPLGTFAVRLLRNDVHSAREVTSRPPFPGLWSTAPLELAGHPAGRVRYEVEDGRLVRSVRDAGGEVVSRRPVLDSVEALRWLPLAPGLLALELSYRELPLAADWRVGPRPRPPRGARTAGDVLVLALRGAPRGPGW